ncbi:DUF4148 domain-containing protein [Pseudorhodoferax sp. Leaf267]|uniref:DUF4148 domain-containing protein n=1 Tax=Pseudorhodoferax sp. Leaf267 TaxID=1736316 RepID=UPI0006F9AA94|nr:DUF4148 domain-containing protein [Pseudorhodoferax sp. Leaf267]KQP13186.1 hypothetical protein ASF43_18965 [Pseudorhodoferax sp. Leaf267]
MLLNKSIACAAFAFAGLGAQAHDAPHTRDQVRAEFVEARSQGQLPGFGEVGVWPEPAAAGRALTRAEVLEDLRVHGPAPSGEGASWGGMQQAAGSMTSRAQVRAQAIAAMRAGALPGGER